MELTKKYTYLEIVISAFRYSTRAVEADTLGGVGGLDGMKRLHRKIRPAAAHSGQGKDNKVDLLIIVLHACNRCLITTTKYVVLLTLHQFIIGKD